MYLRNHEHFLKIKHQTFTLGGFCLGGFLSVGICPGGFVWGFFVLEPLTEGSNKNVLFVSLKFQATTRNPCLLP